MSVETMEREVPRSQKRELLLNIGFFVAQRLAFGVLVLIAIIFLSYLGLSMAQNVDFYPAVGQAVSKTIEYLGRLIRGELGFSRAGSVTRLPVTVAEVVPATLSKSLGLLAASLIFATLIGVPLGIWAAWRKRSGWSLLTILISIAGVSVPSFFAALLLQLGAIRLTRTLGRRVVPVGGFGWDAHMILPALVLAARPIAQIYRVTYVTVSDVLEQDYVRTARSKGLRELLVMLRHVIRNAAIPILTTVGVSLRFSLSSLPVVEFFFSWPGVGFTLLKAISRQDDNLTVALVLCLGILFILVNLLLEVAYRFIDPRLREGNGSRASGERGKLTEALKSIWAEARNWLAHNPLNRLLSRDRTEEASSPFRALLEDRGEDFEIDPGKYRWERLRSWFQATVANIPFVIGAVLLVALFVVFLAGPRLAPHSPYTTRGLTYVDGELSVPPFEPDDVYPWGTDVLGRDMMSLILAGAQQTLLLATLVVAARVAIGIILGSLAGWFSGSWLDRVLMALAEVIAAFPTLLLAMMFILALGIRQGFRPFVIALCLVGWGEVMQFVRGEVMSIRPKLYIESAVAMGLTTPRIIVSHVMPNLLSAIISLAALEMGAVLMLLGELGFVGIFIGGGAFAELDVFSAPYHYSDVPEWGALLSNIRRYARSYPWMAIYPGFAFFIAILGFNFFGEGMRRLVETVGVGITRLVNRYTLAAAALLVFGVSWVQANTGAIAFYRGQANNFDEQWAYARVQGLSHPVLEGRSLGSEGMEPAALHIAQQMRDLGVDPAGEALNYFQTRKRSFEQLDSVPELVIEDGGPQLTYRQDFVEYLGEVRNIGRAEGKVRGLALGDVTRAGAMVRSYKALEGLDYSGEILLVPSEVEASYLHEVPCAGILVIVDDPLNLERRHTLSSRDPRYETFGVNRERGGDRPKLWISEEVADRLLEGTDHTAADLRDIDDNLGLNGIFELPTESTVSMAVEGTVREEPVRHVLGHITGSSDSRYGGINNRMIVVMAQYDTPPLSPDGVFHPAANDNASGVAVMLEAIRTMQETGYQPYKTFLFVAYSAEGLEGGEPVSPPDVERFLEAKAGFSSSFDIEAVVDLRGVGAGAGDSLIVSAGGSIRLADLLEQSARQVGANVRRGGEAVDISIIFEEKSAYEGGQEAPRVGLSWEGWRATAGTAADTLETISEEKLEQAGRALTLALMIMGRETQY